MKKEYKTPTMKVVAIRTERLMNNESGVGSEFSINNGPANPDAVAWGKEENAGDFGW